MMNIAASAGSRPLIVYITSYDGSAIGGPVATGIAVECEKADANHIRYLYYSAFCSKYIEHLIESADGFIVDQNIINLYAQNDLPWLTEIQRRKPLVICGTELKGSVSVAPDMADICGTILKHLRDVHGRTRPVLVGTSRDLNAYGQEFQAAASALGWAETLPTTIDGPITNSFRQLGADSAIVFFDPGFRTQLAHCARAGLAVPSDFPVVSLRGTNASREHPVTITHAIVDPWILAARSVQVLLQWIRSGQRPVSECIPFKLHLGESCGCVPLGLKAVPDAPLHLKQGIVCQVLEELRESSPAAPTQHEFPLDINNLESAKSTSELRRMLALHWQSAINSEVVPKYWSEFVRRLAATDGFPAEEADALERWSSSLSNRFTRVQATMGRENANRVNRYSRLLRFKEASFSDLAADLARIHNDTQMRRIAFSLVNTRENSTEARLRVSVSGSQAMAIAPGEGGWDIRGLLPPQVFPRTERWAARVSFLWHERVTGYVALELGTRDWCLYNNIEWDLYTNIVACALHEVTLTQANLLKEMNNKLLLEAQDNQQAMVDLAHQATHDPLTQLGNRAMLLSRLDYAIKRLTRDPDSQFALLYIDLDRFKPVNDQYGHEAGDEVLKQIAHRLTKAVRNTDVAARFGGDEFAVLLDSVSSSAEAVDVADRIRQAVAAPIHWQGQELTVGCSIGVVMGSNGTTSPEDLIRTADSAMYDAKRGRHSRPVLLVSRTLPK